MDPNMSPIDQWIRIIVGMAAGWEFFLIPEGRGWILAFALFFFFSGMLGSCPIYSLIGVGTRRTTGRQSNDRDSIDPVARQS